MHVIENVEYRRALSTMLPEHRSCVLRRHQQGEVGSTMGKLRTNQGVHVLRIDRVWRNLVLNIEDG